MQLPVLRRTLERGGTKARAFLCGNRLLGDILIIHHIEPKSAHDRSVIGTFPPRSRTWRVDGVGLAGQLKVRSDEDEPAS
jgi:hypothetical protein